MVHKCTLMSFTANFFKRLKMEYIFMKCSDERSRQRELNSFLQDVDDFVREKEELERDRLRMHAENDALRNQLEEMQREQVHVHV
jgi:NurA-like 5'-3' nuclease